MKKARKEIETKIEMLEKMVQHGYNYGVDKRIGRTYSAMKKFSDFGSGITEDNFDLRAVGKLGRLLELRNKVIELAVKYMDVQKEYVPLIRKSMSHERRMKTKEEENKIKEKVKETWKELGTFIRETIDDTGILDELWKREEKSLRAIGLRDFITESDKNNYVQSVFSERSIDQINTTEKEIRLQALLLFWVNKFAKVVDDCMLGFMLDKQLNESKQSSNGSVNELTDEDRKICLLKVDLLRQFINYSERRFSAEHMMSSDEDFDRLLSSAGVKFEMLEFLRYMHYMRKDEDLYEWLKERYKENKEIKNYYDNMPEDYKQLFCDIESRYNALFSDELDIDKNATFTNDFLAIMKMKEVQDCIYSLKDGITGTMVLALMYSRRISVTPLYKVWGVSYDRASSADSDKSSILFLEMPGFIKPLMVHVEDELLEMVDEAAMQIGTKIPEYNGMFRRANNRESYLSAAVLFPINEEQKKRLKSTIKTLRADISKRKKEISKMPDGYEKVKAQKVWEREKQYFEVIKYMEAMANNKDRGQSISID